jgi:hypothetical protein
VWHYEYAVYNQNLDRGIQSFTVPVGAGATISNVGFHAPPQHPGWTFDGTVGNSGFSSAAWNVDTSGGNVTWSTETIAQNPNANAIRWGTLYNFRFDSNRPPTAASGTLGFFKTGSPMAIQVQGPSAAVLTTVSAQGRVTTVGGQGIRGVPVALTDAGGNLVAYTQTNSFGVYNFSNITPGQMYTIEPLSKRYVFTAQTMAINSNLTDVNFVDESGQ